MKLRLASVLFFAVILTARAAVAQDSAATAYPEPPVIEPSQATPPNTLELGQLVPLVDPPLPTTNFPVASPNEEKYQTAIKALDVHRHTYVHIKLKNGKVLTGLLRSVGEKSFSLHTTAFGGPTIFYKDLVEQPRAVPAVGTRIKQGAQWTGIVILVAAVIPILIPLMLTGAISDC